uniref:Uncharacterized protein n=2 Tax=Tetranychus urticae TaxID=32264 RepID=T1KKD3_TETUR
MESVSLMNKTRLAIIRSSNTIGSKDISIYKWALRKHGFLIEMDNMKNKVNKMNSQENDSAWNFLICLDYSGSDDDFSCFNAKTEGSSYQKRDGIPGLKGLLGTKESFCSTIHEIHKISTMKNPFSPLCFILPHQYQAFLDVSDALGYSASWAFHTEIDRQSINIFTDEGRNKLRDYTLQSGIIQQTISNPLTLFGSTLTIRLFIAITSINPLRAYIHKGGLVYYTVNHTKSDKTFEKVNGHLWTLDNFWDYMTINYGANNVSYAQSSIKNHLTQFLLITEALLLGQMSSLTELNHQSSSSSSYSTASLDNEKIFESTVSLLAFDVTLNSSLDSWILGVSMGSQLQKANHPENGFLFNKLLRTIYDDYLSLITATTTTNSFSNSVQIESLNVVNEVYSTLIKVLNQDNVGLMGLNCHITHDVCLSSSDLTYLLNWKSEEKLNSNGFQCLYPTLESSPFIKLIEETSSKIVKTKLEKGRNSLMVHRTWDLHAFLMQMDIVSRRIKDEQNFPSQLNSNPMNHQQPTSPNFTSPIDSTAFCNQDESSLPYISSLKINPTLNLNPAFSPQITQYYANVTHDILIITVYGAAMHCSSEVRVEGKFGPSRPTNYTLGLGINKVALVVVDVSQAEPMVINTYNVYINRLPLTSLKLEPTKMHKVCHLNQDCDLTVYPHEKCGLIGDGFSWFSHLEKRKSLSSCSSGSEPGKWSIPCLSCKQKSSCIWSSSRWQPDSCEYDQYDSMQLSKCLSGRKILFIGDSTNRGLMNYLMEKLNGSLSDGNKTHELRIYDKLNQGKTLIGFNYYPKFWLPSFKRLTFDKTVHELIEKALPLANTSDTVLIFGGVQWLASQHINLLLQSLSSLQLTGIKVIMKTLGAGFHQKIDGIHSLSLDEQQKLALHNQRLIELAESHNIAVVDTYNMTISRYKDFYPGKCLCHFHQVVPIQEINQSGQPWTRYHIEGDINAACGEILINLLCQNKTLN